MEANKTSNTGITELTKSIGLGEQVGFQSVHRCSGADLCQDRVPKGGRCHTEGYVPKSLQAGMGGGEQTRVRGTQIPGTGCSDNIKQKSY